MTPDEANQYLAMLREHSTDEQWAECLRFWELLAGGCCRCGRVYTAAAKNWAFCSDGERVAAIICPECLTPDEFALGAYTSEYGDLTMNAEGKAVLAPKPGTDDVQE